MNYGTGISDSPLRIITSPLHQTIRKAVSKCSTFGHGFAEHLEPQGFAALVNRVCATLCNSDTDLLLFGVDFLPSRSNNAELFVGQLGHIQTCERLVIQVADLQSLTRLLA